MNRRDLLAALGAAGGLAVIAGNDGDVFAPIIVDDGDDGDGTDDSDDGTTDTMTLDVTQLSEVSTESGLQSIGAGSNAYVTLGTSGTEYELLGGVITRQEDDSLGTDAMLHSITVSDGDGTTYDVMTGIKSKDAGIPFAISPVNEVHIHADENNSSTWTWYYTLLFR